MSSHCSNSYIARCNWCRVEVNLYPLYIDKIGFSQKLVTVHENDRMVRITIFSYFSEASLDDLVLNFTTHGGNATEGDDIKPKYMQSNTYLGVNMHSNML